MERLTADSLSKEDIIYILNGDSFRSRGKELPTFHCDRCLLKTPYENKEEIRFGEMTDGTSTWFATYCAYCWQRADTDLLDETNGEETHTWTTWQGLNDALAKKCQRQIKPAHKN
tara:strand:- start:520 stop:864 length:345 start_codon:yes stop_codon:yes gene_type:complete